MQREIIHANTPIPEPGTVLENLLKEFPDYKGNLNSEGLTIRFEFVQASIKIARTKGWNKFEITDLTLNGSHPSFKIGFALIALVTLVFILIFQAGGIAVGAILLVVGFIARFFTAISQQDEMHRLHKNLTDYLVRVYDGMVRAPR